MRAFKARCSQAQQSWIWLSRSLTHVLAIFSFSDFWESELSNGTMRSHGGEEGAASLCPHHHHGLLPLLPRSLPWSWNRADRVSADFAVPPVAAVLLPQQRERNSLREKIDGWYSESSATCRRTFSWGGSTRPPAGPWVRPPSPTALTRAEHNPWFRQIFNCFAAYLQTDQGAWKQTIPNSMIKFSSGLNRAWDERLHGSNSSYVRDVNWNLHL